MQKRGSCARYRRYAKQGQTVWMPRIVSDLPCAEVEGVVEGGEWLRVGERVFLPMKVGMMGRVSVEPGWGRWDHAAHHQGGTCPGGGGGACAQGAEPCKASELMGCWGSRGRVSNEPSMEAGLPGSRSRVLQAGSPLPDMEMEASALNSS